MRSTAKRVCCRLAPNVGEHERLAVARDAFGRPVEGDERDAEAAADRRVAEHAAVARPHRGDVVVVAAGIAT